MAVEDTVEPSSLEVLPDNVSRVCSFLVKVGLPPRKKLMLEILIFVLRAFAQPPKRGNQERNDPSMMAVNIS